MRKSDLIDVALKLFGIGLIISAVISTKDAGVIIYSQIAYLKESHASEFIMVYLTYGLTILFQLTVGLFLVRRSRKISRRLVNADEDPAVNITLDKRAGLEIAFVVVGGFLIINGFQSLGFHVIKLIQIVQSGNVINNPGIMNIVWTMIMMFAGYIVIAARTYLARHFTKDER